MYNKILKSKEYIKRLNIINEQEINREYCKHEMTHFLDVARIAMLINDEKKYGLSKELIYSTALLHDIGRSEEYINKTPHDEAGIIISKIILSECNARDEDMECILYAIGEHRGLDEVSGNNQSKKAALAKVIKEADKLSRNCFDCKAVDTCKWPDEKKNMEIYY